MNKLRGFTLFEMLIALVVFAIFATITTSVLYQMFDTRNSTKLAADRVQELQIAYVILSRDFSDAVPKPIFYNSSIALNPFTGHSSQLSFTRSGYSNPEQLQTRSELQRINLRVENGLLIRRRFDKIDHHSEDEAAQRILLHHVKAIHFRYYDKQDHATDYWPLSENVQSDTLPNSIELQIELSDWGSMTWDFLCTGG